MDFYGLERDFQAAGFFETEQHHQLKRAIRPTLLSGKLAAITGPVASGKTLFLHHFEMILKQVNGPAPDWCGCGCVFVANRTSLASNVGQSM